MQKRSISALAFVSFAALATTAAAEAIVGHAAPSFTATDSNGKTRSLDEFKGKAVVLEWWNPGCPFVGKHYGSGNMQRLQKEWISKGVVWLTIDSSAPGQQGQCQQGQVDGERVNAYMKQRGAAPTAVLLDPEGTTGRAYGAKTTPHMFVIDGKGTLVYAGGIDDKPSTDEADVPTAHNYVAAALEELAGGKPVTTKTSQPYGCGVKYRR
jgi:hypothetical protein